MRVQIYAEPRIRFSLTKVQLDLLALASKHHYDHTCRLASAQADRTMGRVNGCITLWKWAQADNDDALENLRQEFPLLATNRELQICAKCLEMPVAGETEATIGEHSHLFMIFVRMIHVMGPACKDWDVVVEI